MSEGGQKMYYSIAEDIKKISSGLVISPLDAIKQKIEKQGLQ